MGNCICPQTNRCVLSRDHFDYSKIEEVSDENGNRIFRDGPDFVLEMAKISCWKSWTNFLWNHVQPFVRVKNVRIDWPITDQSDCFEKVWNLKICFLDPGTVRSIENQDKILR